MTAELVRFPLADHSLECPFCRKRDTTPLGAGAYLCVNRDCPGAAGKIAGKYVSILHVDAIAGARLIPLATACLLEDARRRDPRALIAHHLPVRGAKFIRGDERMEVPAPPRLRLVRMGGVA